MNLWRRARVGRHLAAILAADVAGYGRLMSEDEEGTLAGLRFWRHDIAEPRIRGYRGQIIKSTGDGFLVEFGIGINLGDIIAEDNDIYGDGVNVAARLEALAEPAGICISHTVRDQIRDKLPYTFDDRGEQQVKNIARPVQVYGMTPDMVVATDLVAPPTGRAAHRGGGGRTIAAAVL